MPALDFDPNSVPPSEPRETIPEGWYQAVIVKSEEKETKDTRGSYIEMQFQIIAGPHEGHKVYGRYNLNNPSDQAVGIARSDIAAIVKAIGATGAIKSTEQMHDIPMQIKVVVRPPKGEYAAQNEIKGYRTINQKYDKPEKPQSTGQEKAPWKPKK